MNIHSVLVHWHSFHDLEARPGKPSEEEAAGKLRNGNGKGHEGKSWGSSDTKAAILRPIQCIQCDSGRSMNVKLVN